MRQIGVLTGKPCTFLVQWVVFDVWHYKNRFGRKMAHSFCSCLDACKKRLSIGIYSINRASERLWLETQETPQNGQIVHGFQVRIKDAPTCCRAPRWHHPKLPRKIPKKYLPGPKFWTPNKYPQNTEKKPKRAFLVFWGCFFWYFRGILGVNSRISAQGGMFFRYFSWNFRVGPSQGSVAGRGVLKVRTPICHIVPVSRAYPCRVPCPPPPVPNANNP